MHIVGFSPEKVYVASLDHALSIEFVGSRKVEPRTISTKAGGKKGTFLLGTVEYRAQWEGITVRYDATEDGIAENTYLLEPGADVRRIKLKYNVPVKADADGALRFKLPSTRGWMTETAPLAWQEIRGEKMPVKVAFKVQDGLVGFEVGRYDPQHALIIDPVYRWHTFYGQAQSDSGKAIAVDGNGNVYIAGESYNSVTPGSWTGPEGQLPLHPHSGGPDIMVMKLDSSGTYQWHTFYGDDDNQWANGIAVDGDGNVYVTGFTDGAQWLGDEGAEPLRYGQADGAHIVVLKLDTDGVYQWHTFYGYWVDEGKAIAVDGGGDVYVTGYSSGSSGQGWVGMTALHAHSGSGYDLVVLKLDTNGDYQWHTFYGASGGTGYDEGNGIAVDANGNVYVTGESDLTWQGSGASPDPLHAHSNPGEQKPDIFVLKLDTEGAYRWHTFHGATYANPYWALGEIGYGIALDPGGNVYVTGEGNATWGTPLHAHSGARDITVLKLNNAGVLQWHTFYGSNGSNYGRAIAVKDNNVFVAGDGYTSWLGDGGANPLHPHTSSSNIALLKLDTDGAYRWHTFYGSGDDLGYGVAADDSGNVYVTGESGTSWQGDGGTAPLHAHTDSQGYPDITVLKLNLSADLSITMTDSPDPVSPGRNITYTMTVTNNGHDTARNVVVTDDLPASVTFVSAYSTQGNCGETGGLVTCNFGDMENGAVVTATITVTATAAITLSNTASVSSDTLDPNAANNTATQQTTVRVAEFVRMLSPNGGETVPSGLSQPVEWEAPPAAVTFKLHYSLDKGVTWKQISSFDPITGTSHEWSVPAFTKDKKACLVRVTGYNANNKKVGSDKSDTPFRIKVVGVDFPNGGDQLTSGTSYNITWTTNGTVREVESISVQYTIDGGLTWKSAGLPIVGSNPGTFSWTPSVNKQKKKCKVKVILKDAEGRTVASDTSDTFFTIDPQ
jgi:uncharacterized repeat protein (TIGR01451 family)